MALKATVFKAELQIADMDRHYYQGHSLTIARHPSETDTRMMVRVLAFALHADEALAFTKGLCADDEPDLWRKNPMGDIELWIELGQPDEKRIRKACQRADQVVIYSYGERAGKAWRDRLGDGFSRFDNLEVVQLGDASVAALSNLAQRSMRLQFTRQDGQVWLGDDEELVSVDLRPCYP